MRLPNKCIIAGREFKIDRGTNEKGGAFFGDESKIYVERRKDNQEDMQIFIHEVIEAILTYRGHRYDNVYSGEWVFMFNHDEFTSVCYDIYLALKGVLKKENKK